MSTPRGKRRKLWTGWVCAINNFEAALLYGSKNLADCDDAGYEGHRHFRVIERPAPAKRRKK